ncbi:MAG: class I SAM-dependent methyltransferase, partial [Clostridiales bacterium]|nr:class I SAM-dependent methyltransferase [Clostridiales bacterium]
DSDPQTESDRKIISYRQYGINLEFVTDTDVFSKSQVDFGSDLMIQSAIRDLKERDAKVWSILDLGCGYGVVGIVMKKVFKGAEVTCVDKNKRAVNLARENGINNGTPLKACMESDCLSAIDKDEKFDLILTNPPVRAGKETVFKFYEQSYEHLNEGGSIYVVLQRKQGAPSTEKKLNELFGNCETCDIKAGYRVMRSIK